MIDKLVAMTAGMAAALYFLAGSLAWYRFIRPRPASLRHVRAIILDRAIAWTSLAVLFCIIMIAELGLVQWDDDNVDLFRIVALAVIYVCGLASIRAITIHNFGHGALIWFAGLSFAAGMATMFFS